MNLCDEFLNDWFKKRLQQYITDNHGKIWNYEYLSLDVTREMSYTVNTARDDYIRKRFQEWFRKSLLKEELMANVWHPKNWEKFKYLDPETFDDEIK